MFVFLSSNCNMLFSCVSKVEHYVLTPSAFLKTKQTELVFSLAKHTILAQQECCHFNRIADKWIYSQSFKLLLQGTKMCEKNFWSNFRICFKSTEILHSLHLWNMIIPRTSTLSQGCLLLCWDMKTEENWTKIEFHVIEQIWVSCDSWEEHKRRAK